MHTARSRRIQLVALCAMPAFIVALAAAMTAGVAHKATSWIRRERAVYMFSPLLSRGLRTFLGRVHGRGWLEASRP